MLRPILTRLYFLALLSCTLLVLTPCRSIRAQGPGHSQELTTQEGVALYNKGNFFEAIKVLEVVTKKHSDDAEAWYYLGLAYFKSGHIGNSPRAFEHALELQPTSADANAKLSYGLILGNERVKAAAAAQRAIELGDLSAEPHYALAEVKFRVLDYKAAIEEAEKALKIDSRFSAALVIKSLAHYNLKQTDEAVAALEQLLMLNSADLDAEVWRNQIKQMSSGVFVSRSANDSPDMTGKDPNRPMTGKEVTTKVHVTSKPEPQYTEEARRAGVVGTVALRAVFSSDGQVKNILVREALGYGLTSAAVNAAKRIKFTPAQKDGSAVSMYIHLEYNFHLY
ncbi:MAG TPA: TonB family protein [Pyrinomonadaceae bacterium]|nr:TonB family protein [Pyrinomonadaceae bacterium]